MKFEFVKRKMATFYKITEDSISKAEEAIKIKLPKELVKFYNEIGCGFLGSSSGTYVNRLMDPISICDFRLRQDDYEFYPDIELYDNYEDGKIVFFEQSLEALFSIEVTDKERSKIYYYDLVIANSLEEFLRKMVEDELYYTKIE